MKKIAILGNGVTAVTAIRDIRRLDEEVPIDVFSDEKYPYYPRPKLIDFIRGEMDEKQVIQYDNDWYESKGVNLRLGEAVHDIIPASRSVLTQKDTYIGYDRILLAVGSHPFIPPIHGTEKKNVHVLRTLDDAKDIKEAIQGTGREIIVGGGILGIELAGAIRKAGGEPIVISNIGTLLPAQLDQGASNILMSNLQKMGMSVLMGFNCKQVQGHEMATGVVSTEGDKVKGDLVVIAAGVRANTKLALDAGLKIGSGRAIFVDEHMQTSERGIYAAGDCTEWKGICWGIIPVAIETAKIAAQNIVEEDSASYEGTTPSNTLQVVGIDLTSIGEYNPQSTEYESIVMANAEEGTYYKAVMKDHVLVGGISLGNKKVAMKLRRLIREGVDISDQRREIFEV
ncbi:MAG: FAD-dependent oxidoreductase [Candidatus Thorarchaeota archaeon]|nr:FAD-dependent oxidoreductase [Candidatus Thorarchaeota archaeon]